MLSHFLKKVIGKTLAIPLAWGSLYPSITGDIIVKDVALKKPAATAAAADREALPGQKGRGQKGRGQKAWEQKQQGNARKSKPTTVLAVKRVEINLGWTTLFSEVLRVDEARFFDAAVDFFTERPLEILHCLQHPECRAPRAPSTAVPQAGAQQAGVRGRLAQQANAKPKKRQLKLLVSSLVLSGGLIRIYGPPDEDGRYHPLKLRVVEIRGKNVRIPLEHTALKLQAKLQLEYQSAEQQAEALLLPLMALLQWDAKTEQLLLKLRLKRLPLAVFHQVFPRLALRSEATVGGTVSGDLLLAYETRARAWKIL